MTALVNVTFAKDKERSYPIIIGTALHRAAKNIPRSVPSDHYFIVTDSNVGPLYGEDFARVLEKNAKRVDLLVVKAGEQQKNRKTKERLEDAMLRLDADRNSVVIALGGGVVGDLAGFVAATLLRGVRFIQLPTTLLAQVDSSVGGKVAVNHPLGKNLIGAFHQPERVYVDERTLQTLSETEFQNGLAEVIKYASVLDEQLFAFLEEHVTLLRARNLTTLSAVIERCCELKRAIVERDELENGSRRILNFGHTIGHGVENATTFRVSHGRAVAMGMCYETLLSQRLGLTDEATFNRLRALLDIYELPTRLPSGLKIQRVVDATSHDKKARNGRVLYTLIKQIGNGVPDYPLTEKSVQKLLTQ